MIKYIYFHRPKTLWEMLLERFFLSGSVVLYETADNVKYSTADGKIYGFKKEEQ